MWPLNSSILGLSPSFTLYASFAFKGVAAWTIGLVYISYDSLLLAFMVVSSQVAVMRQERQRKATTAAMFPHRRRQKAHAAGAHLRAQRTSRLAGISPRPGHETEPADEIIVLDDGSTDGMTDWLTAEFALTFTPEGASALGQSLRFPGLRVWRKPNTGKADSLNVGWKIARGEIGQVTL